MTKAIKKISKSEKIRPVAFKLFLIAVFSLSALYIYFVAAIITKTVDSEQKLKTISDKEEQNTELERKYISFAGKLDMDYARANSFVDYEEKILYVTRYNSITRR